ncbi:sulfotransferase family 2 domain-containing protein [Tropicimonas marinistellae]|uniref:sulfotransferase family 2 domain-containing protein n=1 Tax=Tropicimonas marinistellae TaxID=1739787 RepID=UPI0013724D00|nr:sulfotransferase family 2 domain-containing protein [Tropicimonas marinistellae]
MISRRYKTVFVHIPKTGGQSVECVFLKAHGLDWESRAPLLLRRNADPAQGPERLAHLYADEYAERYLSREEFESFFKFAIVRNPYDRLLSEYRYRGAKVPLWLFLLRPLRNDYADRVRHLIPQTRYIYSRDGELLVDAVIRFEDIADEMPRIFQRTIGEAHALPHVNKSRKSSAKLRLSWLSRLIIRYRYAKDFRCLGYDRHA